MASMEAPTVETDGDSIEDSWDGWSTEQLETERAEIEEEIVNITGQLEGAQARAPETRSYEWEARARAARRYRMVERTRLDVYLGHRRKRDRAKAHTLHQIKNHADRSYRDFYMLVASKELPPEWHEFIKARANEEQDNANDAYAKALAESLAPGRPILPPA